MERQHLLGLGGFAALVGVLALGVSAYRDEDPKAREARASVRAHLKLSQVATDHRQAVDYAALDARLKRLIEKPTMVGMAVGVVENGRITFLSGYGETLEGSGEKVTPQTVFRWASVSKGVASTLVVKLAEMGKVDLSAPIAAYRTSLRLPGGNEQVATVGDLLSHRVGLYRNAYDNKLEEGESASFLRQTLFTLNSTCQPGTCWSYQNVAYDASSEIVARETGTNYEEAAKRLLFRPIGMTSASVSLQGLTSAKSWARGHSVGRRPIELNDNYYRVPAAGGVNSNIKDLALWMIAQMGEMPDVLSPQVLRTLHQPLVKTPGERGRLRKFAERLHDPYYGYGWRSYDYAGHRIVGHRGGVNGYRSLILFDPALKSGVVALWNSNTSQPGGVEFEVMDMLYRLPFRDWMEVDRGGAIAASDGGDDAASGDPGRA